MPSRIIKSRFSSKCHHCGERILKGKECWYQEEHHREYFLQKAGPRKGLTIMQWCSAVWHKDGECASPYSVHIIYAATRKIISVSAFSQEEALAKAVKADGKGKKVALDVTGRTAAPVCIEVWQGNMRLMSRSA